VAMPSPKSPTQRELALHELLRATGLQVALGAPDAMALTALKAWCGQPTTQSQLLRQYELLYILMLSGDRAANHLFYWRDDEGAEWTPNLALYAQEHYGLPSDPATGVLVPEGLAAAVRAAATGPVEPFATRLRADIAGTLLACGSALTAVDAEQIPLYPGQSLQAWGQGVTSPHATRWRQVQSFVERNRIPAKNWK
jgi:hypothetical protein